MSNKLSFIGLGRLGLATALCLEKAGFNILGLDINDDYIKYINDKTLISNEPQVSEYLQRSTNLKATNDLDAVLNFSDIIFILVQTPNLNNGIEIYDCVYLNKVLLDINAKKVNNKHIVICCTVGPGYFKDIGRNLIKDCTNTTMSYNPEFIAQGSIIEGLMNPDIVLIGSGSEEAGLIIEDIYKKMCPHLKQEQFKKMSPESAEITKLGLNCFITTKISFANMIGLISDKTPGSNKFDILDAIGADSRVNHKYLRPGLSYGGPCFPRDNRALGLYARSIDVKPFIPEATDKYNNFHSEAMAHQLMEQKLDYYIIEDVAYKENCPVFIIEESPKLEISKKLVENGHKVIIKDRKGIIDLVIKEYGSLFDYIVTDH